MSKEGSSTVRVGIVAWALVAAMVSVVGCQQYLFTPPPAADYKRQALEPPVPPPQIGDLTDLDENSPIRTVVNPEAKPREITLAECIALALENGRTGEFFDGLGRRDTVLGLTGATRSSPSNQTDSIRVFAYDPALLATEIEQSLAKFDAIWQTSMTWNKVDRPRNVLFGLRGVLDDDADRATLQSQLVKPLPTGGVAGITFRTDYEFSNISARFGRLNPSYTPSLQFSFEQPLLRGFGIGINQLRDTHPGGVLSQFSTGGRVPGIILTRIAYDQQRLEFERRIHDLLYAVEEAYWDLYCAYWDLYSREIALRQAHASWQIAKLRLKVGNIPEQDFRQIEQQLQLFRVQRLQALGQGIGRPGVLEAERRLRYLTGLPRHDGYRLIPVDKPTVAPFIPDWHASISEALARRPELAQIRQEIQAAHLAVLREKDSLLPDLRFFSSYSINALGSELDGTGENNALRNLLENRFNDWQLGLRLDVPFGFREPHALVQRARLQLAQRVAFLRDQEQRLAYNLERTYRELIQFREEIKTQRARRVAAAEQLRLEFQLFEVGAPEVTIDVLLDAQRNFAEALREEHFAICNYNKALADFERQKGTILDYDNVVIAEGPLPKAAQARASEHIQERLRSIKIAESKPPQGTSTVLRPLTPTDLYHPEKWLIEAAPVPDLFKRLPPLPEEPADETPLPPTETLPGPKRSPK